MDEENIRQDERDRIQKHIQRSRMDAYDDTGAASTLEVTNPKHVCHEIRQRLRGFEQDAFSGQWMTVPDGKALLTEEGIRSVMFSVESILNQNSVLSNLTEEVIVKMVVSKGDEIIQKLIMKRIEFGIDKAELNSILNLVTDNCYNCLMRALRNQERVFHKSTLSEQKVSYDMGPQPRRQLFRGKEK